VPIIERFTGREILDSRGTPTVEATCILKSGARASASVPSGASVGKAEARELRDGDQRRYRGLGCRKAAGNISLLVQAASVGIEFENQGAFDRSLLALDGTPDKSNLGGNTLLAASIAFARAVAAEHRIPLWQHFAEMVKHTPSRFPRLTINLFSGGKHAGQQVAIQDVLVVPVSPLSIDDSLAMTHDVYHAAAKLTFERHGMRLLRADEGGMAPPFRNEEEMIETAIEAVSAAGLAPGKDVALAIDVAATHFYSSGTYHLKDQRLSSDEMIDCVRKWVEQYPIVSVEDALHEDDWEYWPKLKDAIQDRALVLGDDLLCTNVSRIRRAIREGACNALLLKVNQAGTLTEAAEAHSLARAAGWAITISVRSGETEDNWAADLAVGWGGDQFKNGSITQSERLSKYNRLLQIEGEMGFPLNPWPAK
jgi:enolase